VAVVLEQTATAQTAALAVVVVGMAQAFNLAVMELLIKAVTVVHKTLLQVKLEQAVVEQAA
jgi:hypothetical protein